MEFSVCYEFAITRRIPWDEESEVLRGHISEVRAQVSDHPGVEDVNVRSDLSRAQTVFEFTMFGTSRDAVENEIVGLVASAIRGAGAYHQGMMPHEDEVKLRPKLGAWSGLRTPSWRVRRSSITFERGGSQAVAEAKEAAAS